MKYTLCSPLIFYCSDVGGTFVLPGISRGMIDHLGITNK